MRDKLKQYGSLNFLKRSFIFILRKIGVRYNKWLICHQKINLATLPDIILEKKFTYREITFNDFLGTWLKVGLIPKLSHLSTQTGVIPIFLNIPDKSFQLSLVNCFFLPSG